MELSAFTGCIALGMLTWHAWLMLTAQTSVEYRANKLRHEIFSEDFAVEWAQQNEREDLIELRGRSPYLSPIGWRGNMAAVFGTRSLLYAVLPSRRPPTWPPFGEQHWLAAAPPPPMQGRQGSELGRWLTSQAEAQGVSAIPGSSNDHQV